MGMEKHMRGKVNSEYIKDGVLKEHKKYTGKLPSGVLREIARNFQMDELVVAGCKCYRIHPNKNFNGIYVFYLYGGYMCKHITAEQWEFILKLVRDLLCPLPCLHGGKAFGSRISLCYYHH